MVECGWVAVLAVTAAAATKRPGHNIRAHVARTSRHGMPSERLNVLLTGATGRVGGILRTAWVDKFNVRLADVRELGSSRRLDGSDETRAMAPSELAPHESFIICDTADYTQFRKAAEGIDVVVHLAADPNPGADWETSLLPRNVIGCYNGFEAAKDAGCSRIVFASSVNAVTGYGGGDGGRVVAGGGGWEPAPHGVPVRAAFPLPSCLCSL